jgi:rhodanese-related sulfurtransferase
MRPLQTALLACLLCCSCSAQLTWEDSFAKIAADFPGTPNLSTAELAAWLADDTRPAPVLLDVRAPAEFAISHLRRAQNISPAAKAESLKLPKDSPIVAYCSVGYRSSALVQRLRAAGFSRVYNLHGSLFAWANEGRPLWCGSKPATTVHPYDAYWGQLLAPRYRHDSAR